MNHPLHSEEEPPLPELAASWDPHYSEEEPQLPELAASTDPHYSEEEPPLLEQAASCDPHCLRSGAAMALGPGGRFQSSQPRTQSFPGRDMAALSRCAASRRSTSFLMSCIAPKPLPQHPLTPWQASFRTCIAYNVKNAAQPGQSGSGLTQTLEGSWQTHALSQ